MILRDFRSVKGGFLARGERRPRPREGTFGARLYDAQTRWIERSGGNGDWRDQTFADALNVSISTLNPLWKADTPPNAHDFLIRVAEVAHVDPGWLAYGPLSDAEMVRARDRISSDAPATADPRERELEREPPKAHPLETEARRFPEPPKTAVANPRRARGRKHG